MVNNILDNTNVEELIAKAEKMFIATKLADMITGIFSLIEMANLDDETRERLVRQVIATDYDITAQITKVKVTREEFVEGAFDAYNQDRPTAIEKVAGMREKVRVRVDEKLKFIKGLMGRVAPKKEVVH